MKAMKIWFVSCVFALALPLAALAEVPDLALKDFDGKPASLEPHVGKGKWTLVMFWAVHCPICERNKPEINAFYEKHKGKDAEVVGVVIDGMEKKAEIEASLKRHPIKFTNYIADLALMAMNFEIAAEEPFRGTPTYWLFDPKGELVAVNPGPIRAEALESFIARR